MEGCCGGKTVDLNVLTLGAAMYYTDIKSVFINVNHIFATELTRNEYFVLNPEELVDGMYIQVGSAFQRRVSNSWVNISSVIRGEKGEQGIQGVQGEIGLKGEGSVWFNGTGAPGAEIGENGDYYLDNDSGDVYKLDTTWEVVTNIKGVQGEQGLQGDGLQIDASGELASRDAHNGEIAGFTYLDTESGNLYVKSEDAPSSLWSEPIPLRGEQGTPGEGIPLGGLTGQVLVKNSEEDYAIEWVEQPVPDGSKVHHGIENIGTLSFNNASKILTIASGSNIYWYKGEKYSTPDAITCNLTSADDRDHANAALVNDTLYYIYFKDNTGKLYWSPNPFDLKENCTVATIFWNGSIGAVGYEAHNHTRNIDWHINAHLTIGARYFNGLQLVQPVIGGVGGGLNISGGTIFDEDIRFNISTQTVCRIMYKTSDGSKYTFKNTNLPYSNVLGQPQAQYFNTIANEFQTVANNNFVCSWVYATLDTERPIYIVPTHRPTSAHGNISSARDESQPFLGDFGITPELKLLYKLIFKGDGVLQEYVDYRKSTSLPHGFVAATSAASVSFVNDGTNLTSANVQGAIEELDGSTLSYFEDVQSANVSGLNAAGTPNSLGLAIVPKGTGALMAQIPTSTSAGGNARGSRAVDWQLSRQFSDAVASGEGSVISGGYGNLASGAYSSISGGRQALAIMYGQNAYSSGSFGTGTLSQYSTLISRAITTNATPTELRLDGANANLFMPGDRFWRFQIDILAKDINNNDLYSVTKVGACKNPMAENMSIVGEVVTQNEIKDVGANTWSVDISVDTAHYIMLLIKATGEVGKTIRWVAKINLVECT